MGAPFSSPEAEVAALPAENARLRRLLDLTPEQARPPAATQTGLFLDRPGPVTASSSGPDKVRFFRTLFAARTDVYAIRWENARTGRSGWSPAGNAACPARPARSDRLRQGRLDARPAERTLPNGPTIASAVIGMG